MLLKTFVLDTNILLHDAHSLFRFGDNHVVVPAIVIEEIDSKKRLMNEVGRNAREFSRMYKKLRDKNKGKLDEPIPFESGGTFRIELNHRSFDKLRNEFSEDSNDNRIIAVSINLSADDTGDVVLVSNDMLMIAKADALKKSLELPSFFPELYENDRLIEHVDRLHRGYHEILVPPEIIDSLYKSGELSMNILREYMNTEVYSQDFILLKDIFGSSHSGIGRVLIRNQKVVIQGLNRESEHIWGILPKNVQQRMLMELLVDKSVSLVCATGKAGTGKTLLALAAGLSQTEDEQHYQKLLVSKPVIPVGNDIGFLPGEKEEKLRPWIQPIYDNLEFLFDANNEEELTNILTGLRTLKVEALTYIRGRSIPHQFVIIDEVQNLSPHEVKTILTRVGEGTKIVLIGDPEQIDHPYLDSVNNGLTYAVERLKQEDEVGIVHLTSTERSKLAEIAARLL
ncbi:PhoH family protein [Alkalihalobacillus hwajinpoensis]|uniref:PhoH family protein n=1 Tax=Guptibacillus hwajinpoensis TaxID=208199 RepID=UPI0018847796|nr:PhoH family protein [Pseudalkalibacillus hwajinpoensis]MBF0705860.1 PhoH family protein [Pseudalkalibacillus hwajinpoensis]